MNLATCRGPACDRPAVLHGLCRSHYQQERRARPLRPLRGPSTEEGAQITFRCTAELKRTAEKAAKKEGIDAAEWWRLAGTVALHTKR